MYCLIFYICDSLYCTHRHTVRLNRVPVCTFVQLCAHQSHPAEKQSHLLPFLLEVIRLSGKVCTVKLDKSGVARPVMTALVTTSKFNYCTLISCMCCHASHSNTCKCRNTCVCMCSQRDLSIDSIRTIILNSFGMAGWEGLVTDKKRGNYNERLMIK